jgi:hypothetical protein
MSVVWILTLLFAKGVFSFQIPELAWWMLVPLFFQDAYDISKARE